MLDGQVTTKAKGKVGVMQRMPCKAPEIGARCFHASRRLSSQVVVHVVGYLTSTPESTTTNRQDT